MKRTILLGVVALLLVPGILVAQSTATGRSRTKVVTYTLTVNANIKGATVFLGKENKGTAPYSEKLNAGTYEIRVTAKDHKDFITKVELNKDVTITAKLAPVLFKLTIVTNTKKATVFLNKKDSGFTRPDKTRKEETLVLQLRPGTYDVLVKAVGWQDFAKRIILRKDTVIEAIVKPAMASVTLPEKYLEGNAKVFKLYIDGKLINAQLAVKGAIQVPPGEHTVVIASAPAGLRIERTFDFEAGASYFIELTMDFLYSEK